MCLIQKLEIQLYQNTQLSLPRSLSLSLYMCVYLYLYLYIPHIHVWYVNCHSFKSGLQFNIKNSSLIFKNLRILLNLQHLKSWRIERAELPSSMENPHLLCPLLTEEFLRGYMNQCCGLWVNMSCLSILPPPFYNR